MCTYATKMFIEIPPCAKKVIFSTEFVLLDLNPPFYEVNQEVWKRSCAWRNFKNIFCVLSTYPKKPFRTEKSSIFNFRYVKEVLLCCCLFSLCWPLLTGTTVLWFGHKNSESLILCAVARNAAKSHNFLSMLHLMWLTNSQTHRVVFNTKIGWVSWTAT